MANVFRHPGTGREAVVSARCVPCVLFASVAYLAYKRLWTHALMGCVILLVPVFLCCACLLSFTLPLVPVAYSIVIQDLLAAEYLDRGWVEIGPARQ
ncbi:hypothetical protein [Massilia sp. ST3]|uniref:hypothetical protein n=1 Tax=Massilia sp. ST3 TaxID=2824903 RepID=UPI001B8460B9|nr:hypothetical protein [Massilia sp. ST3]MBQ5948717.1 hypothetical protein [Massilia sp. ST3]